MLCTVDFGFKRQPVQDIQIRSLGYDRKRWRLEIEFIWTDDVRQFYPVPPDVYRQLLTAMPMYLFLARILTSRGVRFDYVRIEAKKIGAQQNSGFQNDFITTPAKLLRLADLKRVPSVLALEGPTLRND